MTRSMSDGAALLGFVPSGSRAEALDDRMHRELAASLAHVAEVAQAGAPELATSLRTAEVRLTGGLRVPPEIFAMYYELVERATGDDIEGATDLARLIADTEARASQLPVLALGSEHAERISHWLRMRDGEGADAFAPVDEATRAGFEARLEQGLDLLARGAPDLHAEITRLVRVILLAQAPEGATVQFDGASHYQFWGLLLLNPAFHQTPLAVAEVLAHEAGHSLLFGMMVDEPLVLNREDERFPSPLRADPRPMDGIFHATFVSARMALAMETLAASGVLGAEDRVAAEEAAAADRRNFEVGDKVIRESGKLTKTGRVIIENARAFIAAPALV